MAWLCGAGLMRAAMQFLTDFADQAVLLPVALTVAVGLWLQGWRRGAAAWAIAVVGTVGVMGGLKLAFFACGWMIPWAGLTSPSGHTAIAALVFGGFSMVLPSGRAGVGAAALAGLLAATLFGLTRLALGVHTVPDVLVGGAVGLVGAIAMRQIAGKRPQGLGWRRLLAAVGLVALAFHGQRLAAETRLHWWALKLWPLTACVATSPISGQLPASADH